MQNIGSLGIWLETNPIRKSSQFFKPAAVSETILIDLAPKQSTALKAFGNAHFGYRNTLGVPCTENGWKITP